jgi:hypothetical protein
MLNTNDKVVLGLCGVGFVVSVGIVIWAKNRISYYQGRTDATKDLTREFEILRQNLENERIKKEGEAK